MSDETMTFPQVLRAMAENVEAGRGEMYGLEVYSGLDRKWVSVHPGDIAALRSYCNMGSLRKAPRTIEVAGIQVPEPMRGSLEHGESYWLVNSAGNPEKDKWFGWDVDYYRLRQGNVFTTKEAAQARAEAERRLFGIKED